MTRYLPEGKLINEKDNERIISSLSLLKEAQLNSTILESKALMCDNQHNLIVDLCGIKGVIPRVEGAVGIKEGTVRDIAVISRVNRPVCFVVTDFIEENGETIAVLSRAKAQKMCIDNYVEKLIIGDVIDARITHLESFGAFADIGCGVVSLMPIDAISVSRIEHPKERFTVGMDTSLRLLDKLDAAVLHLQSLPAKATHPTALLHRADLDCAHNLILCAKLLHLQDLSATLDAHL